MQATLETRMLSVGASCSILMAFNYTAAMSVIFTFMKFDFYQLEKLPITPIFAATYAVDTRCDYYIQVGLYSLYIFNVVYVLCETGQCTQQRATAGYSIRLTDLGTLHWYNTAILQQQQQQQQQHSIRALVCVSLKVFGKSCTNALDHQRRIDR